jgi:hypothetical protein
VLGTEGTIARTVNTFTLDLVFLHMPTPGVVQFFSVSKLVTVGWLQFPVQVAMPAYSPLPTFAAFCVPNRRLFGYASDRKLPSNWSGRA